MLNVPRSMLITLFAIYEYVCRPCSHAQKYFIKMQKEGNVKVIPPARPKRHTYTPREGRRNSRQRSFEEALPTLPESEEADEDDEEEEEEEEAAKEEEVKVKTEKEQTSKQLERSSAFHSVGGSNHYQGSQGPKVEHVDMAAPSQPPLQAQSRCRRGKASREEREEEPSLPQVYEFIRQLLDPSSSSVDHFQELNKMSPSNRRLAEHFMSNLQSNLAGGGDSGDDNESVGSMDELWSISSLSSVARMAPFNHNTPFSLGQSLSTANTNISFCSLSHPTASLGLGGGNAPYSRECTTYLSEDATSFDYASLTIEASDGVSLVDNSFASFPMPDCLSWDEMRVDPRHPQSTEILRYGLPVCIAQPRISHF
jgi:hypothetical protein